MAPKSTRRYGKSIFNTNSSEASNGNGIEYKRRIRAVNVLHNNNHAVRHAIRTYSDKFLKLLSLEEAEDEAALRDRLAQWSLTRLQEEGYCVTGLGGYWLEANQFGRPVASFSLGPGILLPENKFENGTQVLISRLDPLKEEPVSGSILSRSQTQLRVCFTNQFDLDEGTWRLDLGRPNLIYNRMRTAISQLEADPTEIMKADPPQRSSEYILEGTQVRDVILNSFMPPPEETPELDKENVVAIDSTATSSIGENSSALTVSPLAGEGIFKNDERIQGWARRYSHADPVALEDDPPLDGLNTSQKKAMAAMIGQRFSLIQGPPGTGKTKTIIETVKLLKGHFKTTYPLLICTYTNVAVDNLVDGLIKAGVQPLRVGYHGSIRDSLLAYTLDYKLEQHPLNETLKKYADEVATIPSKIAELTERCEDLEEKMSNVVRSPQKKTLQRMANMKDALVKLETRHRFLKTRVFATQQKMLKDVVSNADVICTTCITAACHALNIMDFPVVFIDEASMSTEPASLIPIMKGSEHVALIGDHKQLPPVIISHQAKEEGFGISLFERLIEEGHVPSVMLDIQYRMHPNISRFPAKEFYDLALLDGTVDAGGQALPGLEPLNSKHTGHHETHRPSVIFLDHAGAETYHGRSLQNITEADIVASVVEDLLLNNPHLKGQDIGIIAPYVAQIRLLTRFLNTDAEYRKRFHSVLGPRAREVSLIEIKTVDGFEGREKEVIIFSTVRNNQSGHIGFLADKKRLNVGLTRAKRGLFVVGSLSTLREGKLRKGAAVAGKGAESWRRYAEYLTEGDLVVTLSGSELTRALRGRRHEDWVVTFSGPFGYDPFRALALLAALRTHRHHTFSCGWISGIEVDN
ncbi:P-loop containing nucleoside triphosphate hydrolase protein [Pholiota molesta]|nr:P-loop containing nucleoside triphosphate hydrolase protein [Pholiota molesta]